MSDPSDLAQFGKWLTEHQSQLVQELYCQSQADQAALLQKIEDRLVAGMAASAAAAAPGGTLQFKVARLLLEDDIEIYLTTFEMTATLACWPSTQWTYILGPHLSGPAATVWRTMPPNDLADYD